ncbi:insulinase family protein [Phocea massiliensis]|uniref:Insulinase family protein n=1 Tax=Merdimmobilis hominis TaxID=2897707 RepID=A0A939BE11_9FIRM|nr:pitrilysin family protein [Merdimmobilis hominis]MBM6920532.1 insulinase family protein [Merdimmobilis hominis]
MNALHTEEIGSGIWFHTLRDSRFKTNRISVHFLSPLRAETAAGNALISKVLRRSSKQYPDYQSLAKALEHLYGAYIESGVQKRGDCQVVTTAITGIDDRFSLDNASISAQMAKVLSDILLCPVIEHDALNPRYVETEKKSLIESIEALVNEKRAYAVSRALRALCDGQAHGIPVYGEKEQVEALTGEELLAQYVQLIKHCPVHIFFVGCGDDKPAKQIFADAFSGIDREPFAVSCLSPLAEKPFSTVSETLDVAQAKMVLLMHSPIAGSDVNLSAMRVAVSILGGTPMSKLFLNVREKESLCYYCAARYDSYKGIMAIDCGVEEEQCEQAKESILKQVEALKAGDFTEEEIEYAKQSLANGYRCVYESDVSAENFFFGQLLLQTNNTPEEQFEQMMKVQKEDVAKAAQTLTLSLVYVLKGEGEA